MSIAQEHSDERHSATLRHDAEGDARRRRSLAEVDGWFDWAGAYAVSRFPSRSESRRRRPSAAFVAAHVAAIADVSVEELRGTRRDKVAKETRLLAYYLCRKMTLASSTDIGAVFDRDHTTVLSGVRRAETSLTQSHDFARKVATTEAMIAESFVAKVEAAANSKPRLEACPLCRQPIHHNESE